MCVWERDRMCEWVCVCVLVTHTHTHTYTHTHTHTRAWTQVCDYARVCVWKREWKRETTPLLSQVRHYVCWVSVVSLAHAHTHTHTGSLLSCILSLLCVALPLWTSDSVQTRWLVFHRCVLASVSLVSLRFWRVYVTRLTLSPILSHSVASVLDPSERVSRLRGVMCDTHFFPRHTFLLLSVCVCMCVCVCVCMCMYVIVWVGGVWLWVREFVL